MKTFYSLGLFILVNLFARVAYGDACTLSNDLIELNSVTTSGGNCIANLKYSFTLDKNNGNKFAYVHFWLKSNYSNPDYKKGPTKDELGNVLATIALSTDSPVTLLPEYSPDNTVTPIFAGLSVSEVDLGGGSFRITIDNIQLEVAGACSSLPVIVADVWATQSNDKKTPPVHCLLTGGDTILPVTLARFDGTLLDNSVSLSWTTVSETNSSYFDIERSTDAKEFINLTRVEAKGSSNGTLYYHFVDKHPLQGINYYRLRAVDIDGSSESSRIIAVNNDPQNVVLEVLGNPLLNREVSFLLKNQMPSNIAFFNLAGQKVHFSLTQTGNIFLLKPSSYLPSGLYLLSLPTSSGTITRKILVK